MASETPKESVEPVKTGRKGKKPQKHGNTFVYVGTIIILIITIIAFVFVPSVGGGLGSQGTLNFGSYNGKTISYTQGGYLAKQIASINQNLQQQGLNEQNYQLYAYQVWRQAFESTVVHYGILDDVKTAGGVISDSYIDDRMTEQSQFQENGKFSAKLYKDASAATKLALRDEINENALLQYYVEDLYSLNPSSQEIAFVQGIAKNTRAIEYVSFKLSDATDDQVKTWLAPNLKIFRKIGVSTVVMAKEADAKKVQKDVASGKVKFADAVKKNSTDTTSASKDGSLGTLFYYQLASEFDKKDDAEKLMSLAKGSYSDVCKTSGGTYAFYRIDEAASAPDASDPSLLVDARSYLDSFEKGVLEDWAIAKAKDFAASASTAAFDKAGKAAGLTVKSAGPFPINYDDVSFYFYGQNMPLMTMIDSSDELAQAPIDAAFIQSVFSTAPGSVSAPVVLGENVLVFRVKNPSEYKEEDSSSMLALYYPYFFQRISQTEIGDIYLKSPKLKDNFVKTFTQTFMNSKS